MSSETSSTKLSWALMVCTYNRPEMLLRCVRLALEQSRPPLEIIIVDASDGWASSARAVAELLERIRPGMRLVYEGAKVRSTTHQRNQALPYVQADVVFAIDDDSLMTRDCAAGVMDVYEHDRAGRIAGVGIIAIPTPPDEGPQVEAAQPTPSAPDGEAPTPKSLVQRLIDRQLDMDRRFVPYFPGDVLEQHHVEVDQRKYWSVRLLNGFRTTFRTALGRQVQWCEVLLFYGLHEDADFSYRLSRLGALVISPEGRVCHCQAPGGRLPRATVDRLRVLNLAALHRVYSPDLAASRRRIFGTYLQAAALYLFLDPLRGRFSLPGVRAHLWGIARAREILSAPEGSFQDTFQAEVRALVGARG